MYFLNIVPRINTLWIDKSNVFISGFLVTQYSGEEEAIQWTANNDMRDYHKACWEMEFLPVARKLKDRLQPLN